MNAPMSRGRESTAQTLMMAITVKEKDRTASELSGEVHTERPANSRSRIHHGLMSDISARRSANINMESSATTPSRP